MTSTQHAKWIRSGMQWQLARPLVALRDRLRSYGYTVYDIGDKGHLDHIPPEDHTPFSETGWPGTTRYGWVTAIDIMPPGGGGLPSLQALGGQIYGDRLADVKAVSWLKYMNWEPDRNNGGPCYHDQWEPGHKRSSSGDRGHIHLSARSDVTGSTVGDTYDPVARLRGQPTSSGGDDDMLFLAKKVGDAGIYLSSGERRTGPISPAQFGRLSKRLQLLEVDPADFDLVTIGLAPEAVDVPGEVLEAEPVDLDALADKVAARLAGGVAVTFTPSA